MNDDVITDLKQFISSTISQQTDDIRQDISRLDNKIDAVESNLTQRIDRVEKKIDDLSVHVAEALDNSNEAIDMQIKDHETRITKLESAPLKA